MGLIISYPYKIEHKPYEYQITHVSHNEGGAEYLVEEKEIGTKKWVRMNHYPIKEEPEAKQLIIKVETYRYTRYITKLINQYDVNLK